MRIAIVGASGNVGTALVRALRPDGHELVGVARRPPESGEYAAGDGLTWRAIDVGASDATGDLATAFAGTDAVVNLAWGFQPTHDEARLERTALGGTRSVLEAVTAAGVAHVCHMSSLGAYRGTDGPTSEPEYADESWPTDGVPTSAYSRHKAAAERMLDSFEADHRDITVTRVRPSLIAQASAASGLLRYVMPIGVPAAVVRAAKVLPLDRRFRLQLVHADDVADALRRILDQRAGGAFNLAGDPVLDVHEIADALGARHVHVPFQVVRTAVQASWRLHLQQVDAGWLDMAWRLPLLDSGRARRELGWSPRVDARMVLREVVEGLASATYDETPALRPRSVRDEVGEALRGRPISRRDRS